jgi:hypothetical protein
LNCASLWLNRDVFVCYALPLEVKVEVAIVAQLDLLSLGFVDEELSKVKFASFTARDFDLWLICSDSVVDLVAFTFDVQCEWACFAFNITLQVVIVGELKFGAELGLVPAYSDMPIEIQFNPKFELTYNYNLQCNIKRKARPLTLNIKGEGYQIHHTVTADEPQVKVTSSEACKLDFGEFFINETKTKQVQLSNDGDFNFDF